MTNHQKQSGGIFNSISFFAFILLAPAALIVFGVLLFPMISSLVLSFTDLELARPGSGHFVFFTNYITALKNPSFWMALGRTLYFAVTTVTIETTLGLAIAILLNQSFRGRAFVRGLIILPWALPYVVNGIMWKWIYDANYGAMNAFLTQTHLINQYHIWLGEPFTALNLVIFANIWKETPVAAILLLAALQSIPKELHEAAQVDGATKFRSLVSITVPLLKPIIASVVVIKTIWALKEFDLIYIITRGGPADGTNLLSYYVYKNTFSFLKFGYGSALAYLLTIVACLFAVLYIKSLKSELNMES